MMSSLEIDNSFVYDVYMKDIADIICQRHHWNLEQ